MSEMDELEYFVRKHSDKFYSDDGRLYRRDRDIGGEVNSLSDIKDMDEYTPDD